MCEKNGKIINNLPQGVKVPIEVDYLNIIVKS
jgi:hypothetical protein